LNSILKVKKLLIFYKFMHVVFVFRGNVAFITGGGSGIGFRIAEILMRYFTVILLCTVPLT